MQQLVLINLDDLRVAVREVVGEILSAQQEKEPEEYLTAQETATILHVDKTTLWRWGKDEYLVPVKAGKKNLYRKSDVETVLTRRQHED